MALIGVVCAEEEPRRRLVLAVEEMGHRAATAASLAEAVELLQADRKPQLLLVADEGAGRSAEPLLAELERAHPLLPVVAALTRRDAARAVELMRAGACEVAAPPWTRENLSACVSKALRLRGTTFEVVRPVESARYGLAYLAAVAVFLGVSLWYGTLARRRRLEELARKPPAAADWNLPYSHPAGMAWHGGRLWIADWYAQAVYIHDPATLAVLRTIALPAETPAAIAVAGDALYVVSETGVVSKHMLDEGLTLLGRLPERFPYTVGMAYDGLYLWTLDGRSRLIRKHLLDGALSVLAVYDYAGRKPAALAWDGRHLWSVDAADKELLRHDVDDPRRVTYRFALRDYQSGRWRPTGLAWDGVRFWTAAEAVGGPERPGHLFQHVVSPEAVEAGSGPAGAR